MKFLSSLSVLGLLSQSATAQIVTIPGGTTAELRGLSVPGADVIWASGQRGTVMRSVDGGRTWELDTVPGAAKLDLRSIAATSAMVAHAVSIADSGRVFRTTDGGRTWTQQYLATRKGSFFDAIQFWDATHGIAMSDPVDGHFLIITTSDGGDTWQEMSSSRMPPALAGEGAFAASGTALITNGPSDAWFVTGGASVARVFHSSDRGQSWSVNNAPLRAGEAPRGIFSVAFTDRMRGIIAGGDYSKATLGGLNVARTGDGGSTWTVVDSAAAPQGYRSAVTYRPGSDGMVVAATGLSGTDISRDGGLTWTKVDSVGYNSVMFINPTRFVLVGPRGRIATYDLPMK